MLVRPKVVCRRGQNYPKVPWAIMGKSQKGDPTPGREWGRGKEVLV